MMKVNRKPELARTLRELWALEDAFPLALAPDPAHYAYKWHLPLSDRYLTHRRARPRKDHSRRFFQHSASHKVKDSPRRNLVTAGQ